MLAHVTNVGEHQQFHRKIDLLKQVQFNSILLLNIIIIVVFTIIIVIMILLLS